ncbi:extracellular solute-binding protein [Sabulilitoribacter arenilitoris]|uniref:Extracellular solute-binding protein n=1 Tax=Wocania arenilitoris TaxID=2044858 RepID=A0AAE3ENR1_9FLAO|nr:extracellular solute-binding protein [Wocania arenilitoris]MCF7568813.1 extracellular solute-binding protein [Wocania arenilitoris]
MVVLRGITWKNPRGYNPLIEASKKYNKKFPVIEIVWEQYPWYEFEERILDNFKKGTGIYDLIMFDHPWTGTLCSNKWLLPWDEYLSSSYMDELKQRVVAPSVESYNFNGKQWALPLDAASHCALYQKTVGADVALPTKWEEIKEWAIQTQAKGFETPLVLSLQGVLGSCLFLSMMAAYGKPAFHDLRKENIDEDAAKTVLLLLKDLQQFCPEESSKWGPWDIYDKFCENEQYLYSPSIFGYVNYLGPNHAGKNLYITQVPMFNHNKSPKAIIGGVGLGLTYSCKNIPEAVDYGAYLMSDEVQKEIFPPHYGQPAVKAVWEDNQINAEVNNFYKDLQPNMENGYIRPQYDGFHEVELAIGNSLQKWWDDQASLKETLIQLKTIKL